MPRDKTQERLQALLARMREASGSAPAGAAPARGPQETPPQSIPVPPKRTPAQRPAPPKPAPQTMQRIGSTAPPKQQAPTPADHAKRQAPKNEPSATRNSQQAQSSTQPASTPTPAAKPPEAPAQQIEPTITSPQDATHQRLAELEQQMQGIKDLRELSELLSVKYNPFLSMDETASDEGNNVDALLASRLGRTPRQDPALQDILSEANALLDAPRTQPQPTAPAAPTPPQSHASAPGPALHAARNLDIPPVLTPEPRMHIEPVLQIRPPEASRTPAPAPEAAQPDPNTQEGAMFRSTARGVGGPREAYLAMNWFTYLTQGTDPSVIFVYLDYYHFVGWIDKASYDWLRRLAHGVAKPKDGATWSDYGLDVAVLSERHLRNLRFLDKLFGTTLQHGEADYLQQTLDMLLED